MIAAILATLIVAGATGADPQAEGLQALEHRDYARAQELFSRIAAADPKDYSALFNLAFAEAALHQDLPAEEHFRQVLALKPNLFEAELNLGMLCTRDKKPQEAVPLLEDAVKQKPRDAVAQKSLGNALLDAGDFVGATAAFETALKVVPRNGAAELGLAQSLLKTGKLDEAAPHYQAATLADKSLHSYELELAEAYLKANRPADAIPLLKQFPDAPGAREQLGKLFLDVGRADDAVREFQAAVAVSPTAANRLALASAYLRSNHPELAEPILLDALRQNPADYDLLMSVGKIELQKRSFTGAASQFLAAAKIRNAPEAWSNAASSLILAGQYNQALAALDRLRSMAAETPADVYWRAVVLDKLHQVKPALASYRRFLQVSEGKFPDQEFLARHRSIALEKEANR